MKRNTDNILLLFLINSKVSKINCECSIHKIKFEITNELY